MTTVTLRPNALVASNEASVTGGTAQAVTADNSDSTYLNFPDSGYLKMYRLGFDTTAIPANAIVRSVTPRVRHDSTTVPDLTRTLQLAVGSKQFPLETLNYHGTAVTQTGIARSSSPNGRVWTQDDIDALELELRFQLTPTYRPSFLVHALYIDVEYNEVPVAAGAGPNTTVETTRPRFSWTYTDPEGDQQERFIVDVYSDEQYGDPDFDPPYTTPVVSSGEVYSAANYWDCPVALENNRTYRAYVRVCDRGSNGRYSLIGPYAYATVHIVELASPILEVAAPATPAAAVELVLSGRDNVLSLDASDFENPSSGSDVGEWNTAGTNCTAVALTGVGTAESGGGVLKITATANGDCALTMKLDATAHACAALEAMYGGLFFRHQTGSQLPFAITMTFLTDAGVVGDTFESNQLLSDADPVGTFVRGLSIYDDTVRVALGIKIFGAAAGQQFHVDAVQLSPNPINQVRNPAFALDSNADGLADDWTLVNTGGDPAPVATLDRSKVLGGIVSQHLQWEDNGGLKGVQQYVAIPPFEKRLIQVWVAITVEGIDEVAVQVRHGALPWATVSSGILIPTDGEFYPITMQLANTGSDTGEAFRVVSEQAGITGPVDMWIGCTAIVNPSMPGVGDWGAGPYLGEEWNGGPYELALTSGPFSHGEAVSSHYYELQRSLDDGVTWATMARVGSNPDDWHVSDLSDVAPDALRQTLDAFDFEAPSQTVMYRARSVAEVGGNELGSTWSHWVSVDVPVGGWWLKSLYDPSMSVRLRPHNQTLKWTSPSRESVNYALGREMPIILTDGVNGETAALQLSFLNDESYEAFEALRKTATTFLLQSPYGDHRYVRLVTGRDAEYMLNGGHTPKRIVSVTVAETDEP